MNKNNNNKKSIILIQVLIVLLVIIGMCIYIYVYNVEKQLNKSMIESYNEYYSKKEIVLSKTTPNILENDDFIISVVNLLYNKNEKKLSYDVVIEGKKDFLKKLNFKNTSIYFQSALIGEEKKVYVLNTIFSENGKMGNIISKVETGDFFNLEENKMSASNRKISDNKLISTCTVSNVEDMNNVTIYITDLIFAEDITDINNIEVLKNENNKYEKFEFRFKLGKN